MATEQTNGLATAVEKDDLVIPLIDFSRYLHGTPSEKAAIGNAMAHGFKTAGFIYLQNHGIPSDTVENVFAQSAQFFARPQEQKDKLSWTTPQSNRGYVVMGREKVSRLTTKEDVEKMRGSNPDLKESFEIGREDTPGFKNNWPTSPDPADTTFTQTMQSFFLTAKALHINVMRAIALGMNLPETYFDAYTSAGDNNLRLLHYPPVKKSVFEQNKGQVRAGDHTDYGSVTLLFQDMRGGLQVLSPQGTWVNATPIPGTIVINAGDLLARWSNDIIKSTNHRVIEPPLPPSAGAGGEEGLQQQEGDQVYPARYSVAYFCNPNFESDIEALPGTWEKSGKKYEKINSYDYLVQRLSATY
ncbi:MAG: hypothetical protein M1834_004833 [Cirrosporium novae-zelandiae]|nr:MAG: hypothetical protein M1834_004833 [Cirrosporium novae-zelandiae]